MLGWIKCFAAIAISIGTLTYLRSYNPPKRYPRNRHFVEVEYR